MHSISKLKGTIPVISFTVHFRRIRESINRQPAQDTPPSPVLKSLAKKFYRPDIDGLRALAVLPVILFHANLFFPGGFVGVDVFFVISGYLITQIIQRELNANRFSVVIFYQR